jgi:cytochrome c oxidase cbb3-type subunit 1
MPYYVIRLSGGILYLSGMVIMAWNVVMTVRNPQPVNNSIPAVAHHA